MPHQKRSTAHRMIKARQGPADDDVPDGKPGAGGSAGVPSLPVSVPSVSVPVSTPNVPTPSAPTLPSSLPPVPPSSSKPSSTPPATPSSTPRPSSPSPTPSSTPPPSSSSSPPSEPSSTSELVSSSASESSSSSASSASSASAPGTAAAFVPIIGTTARDENSSVIRTVARTSTSGVSGTTVTAEPIESGDPVGGVSTGTIVGGVAGGIAAIAVLGLIVAFLLRRWRKRSTSRLRFDTDDDVIHTSATRNASAATSSQGSDPFNPPSGMAERRLGHTVAPSLGGPPVMGGHNATSSISSGPGMAGHGAYSAGTGAAALQERPRYTYGQVEHEQYRDDMSDHAHGVYSSEPQVQAAYNPEAYGSYAYPAQPQPQAYHGQGQAGQGYQDLQRQEYHQQAQAQQDYGTQDYVVDLPPAPAPAQRAPISPGARQQQSGYHAKNRTSSVFAENEEDAYGGI